MDFVKKFGKNVKIYREALGITQAELAEAADTHTSTIAKIESGEQFVLAKTLKNIVSALNIEYAQLFMFNSISKKEHRREELSKEINDLMNLLDTNDLEFFAGSIKSYIATQKSKEL